MSSAKKTHRTTIEIEVTAFEAARIVLGTSGYNETVNEALRAISQDDLLHRGAHAIRSGDLELIDPYELATLRQPRT